MSLSLACDGLPNCGENIIPNADEACFKVTKKILSFSLTGVFPCVFLLSPFFHLCTNHDTLPSDPLVLCAAEPDLLHPPGHHDAPLHVLLRQDPHPVVSQVLHGGDAGQLREVILQILLSLRRELQSALGPPPAHLRWESEAHQPRPSARPPGPSALQRVFQSEVCQSCCNKQFSKASVT